MNTKKELESFNTLWEMEPLTVERISPQSTVSIPYGKWNQQHSVDSRIIAHKELYVKHFLEKFFYSNTELIIC